MSLAFNSSFWLWFTVLAWALVRGNPVLPGCPWLGLPYPGRSGAPLCVLLLQEHAATPLSFLPLFTASTVQLELASPSTTNQAASWLLRRVAGQARLGQELPSGSLQWRDTTPMLGLTEGQVTGWTSGQWHNKTFGCLSAFSRNTSVFPCHLVAPRPRDLFQVSPSLLSSDVAAKLAGKRQMQRTSSRESSC